MDQNNYENGAERGIAFADKRRSSVLTEEKKSENVFAAKPASEANASYLDVLNNSSQDIDDIKTAHNKKMSAKDKRVIGILAALNLAVIVFLGVYLSVTGEGRDFNMKAEPETRFYDPADTFADELHVYIKNADFPQGIQPSFKRLYSENRDSIGWIKISDTSIDYPVLRAQDNSKYERANFYGEYDRRGSIFMDYRNSVGSGPNSLSKVTILWGHHLTEDMTIFADVEKYMDVEYYKTHPVVEMNTLYDNYKWKVFACFTANVEPEDDGGNVFYYWDPYVSNDDTLGFINECVTRSWIVNPSVDFRPEDKILCLSTCTYILNKYDFHEIRTVLMARLVRDGEQEDVDVSTAYQNENKRMPQLYYDINGLVNPYAGVPCWQRSGNY